MKQIEFEKVNLGIFNGDKEFFVSNFNINSEVTQSIKESFKAIDVNLFIYSEIKGTLDIESEGSSRKVIVDLISGKRAPSNPSERKALNLYSAYNFILSSKPQFTKNNLMTIYNILSSDIDMGTNALENPFDYRQSKEDGFIGEFKTPLIDNLNIGMQQLFNFINSNLLSEYPFEKALLIQIIFIFFHPFYDLNGRTGRIMTFWYLVNSGNESLAKVSLLSLPSNKDKYIKIWKSLRKNNAYDLTFFMNWLGCVSMYGSHKVKNIKKLGNENGVSLNETEILIMFYLLDREHYIIANDLIKIIDLGISKQAFFNAIQNLYNKKLILKKMSANKMFIKSKWNSLSYQPHKTLFEKFIKSQNDHSLFLEY